MMKSKKSLALTAILFICAWRCAAKTMGAAEAQEARQKIAAYAKQCIGCPYRSGAIGPDAYDCSGLVFTVFREAAKFQLPRAVRAIYSSAKIIKLEDAEVGDLVFFKTTGDGSISHLGIYIGKLQFIHAASDGNNTGVIVSSLREKYYKNCFAAVGRVLPSARGRKETVKDSASDEVVSEEDIPDAQASANGASNSSDEKNGKWYGDVAFDAAVFCDWSFFDPYGVTMNWRGVTFESNVYYDGWKIKPGIGTIFRVNYGTGTFQLPLVLSLGIYDYIKVYAGPVFHFGKATIPGGDQEIRGLIFPGILGLSVQTPKVKAGKVGLSLVQDISYTFYNDADNAILPAYKSVGAGLVFSTGLRVTLPLGNIL